MLETYVSSTRRKTNFWDVCEYLQSLKWTIGHRDWVKEIAANLRLSSDEWKRPKGIFNWSHEARCPRNMSFIINGKLVWVFHIIIFVIHHNELFDLLLTFLSNWGKVVKLKAVCVYKCSFSRERLLDTIFHIYQKENNIQRSFGRTWERHWKLFYSTFWSHHMQKLLKISNYGC